MRMNVRCCCDPSVVIGTLEVPAGVYGVLHIPPRLTARGNILSPEWSPVECLKVGEVLFPDGTRERAIKSEDRPDEFWDTLHSFRRGDRA